MSVKMMDDALYLVGLGSDDHRITKELIKLDDGKRKPLLLAGRIVSMEYSPISHSDGDIVYHAITNALLLAIGERDLGYYFPNTDPKWANVKSSDMLKQALGLVKQKGYSVSNISIMITAGIPKLTPHIEQMRKNIATILEVEPSRVGIGATSGEGLSDHARGEGINAVAHVMILRSK
jgi:2-C-methyl-D-erythritol 2,4-cyclodiphosphate synthase